MLETGPRGRASGHRIFGDIDTMEWVWRLRRQTSLGPGGLKDKGTKGKRSRKIPIIAAIRSMVLKRIEAANRKADARLFVGPRGGRIQTGVLRKATHWHEVGSWRHPYDGPQIPELLARMGPDWSPDGPKLRAVE